ncbi:MAG: TetR/AcrR family transcriptional regulator [Candidatus Thiodiazotropha sp. (ex Lucinoma kastoroae)]|nr:TetR/AcrR family transcriptional regulator [Candidatus Thiodiazotropha sp. (ex Rostrolucina anterorostrata)]MCU7847003.1 TetR/AcrR family transcriptional regulator [Candidatus Thiodiazotropha sp. (ex Lucinoma kastoroae)]MCU7860066.1 TetR/AcrR family transcriptional regulator [Candidatus Thiodiazotropha sp. (ex Lucinoma kastoroae)]
MGRRGEHSKSEIEVMALEAAEAIIEAEGYPGLSARKIASAIGYTVGSLYFVFKNLDELVQRVNGRTLDQLYIALNGSLSGCQLPQQCLFALGSAYLDYATRHAHRWRMVFEHQPQSEGLPLEIHEEKVDLLFDLVEGQLQLLATQRSNEEITLAARALWSGVHGIAILAITRHLHTEGQQSVQQLTEHLIGHYLSGLSALEPKAC